MCLVVRLETGCISETVWGAGCVSESVWKLDESQSQFGGWVGLRVSLETGRVSE